MKYDIINMSNTISGSLKKKKKPKEGKNQERVA